MGVRDKVNNLLEVGSVISAIEVGPDGDKPVLHTSESDWLLADIQHAFCFGCKRMSLSGDKEAMKVFVAHLPPVVKDNAK